MNVSNSLTQMPQGTNLRWKGTSKVVLEGVQLLEVGQVTQAGGQAARKVVGVQKHGFQIDVVADAFGNITRQHVF